VTELGKLEALAHDTSLARLFARAYASWLRTPITETGPHDEAELGKRRLAMPSPRISRTALMLAATLGASGCVVSASRYNEAVALTEQTKAELRLVETRHAEQQRAEAQRCEQRIAELEQHIAESRYEASVAKQELEHEQGMVTQLRGELERVANHLREYSERNRHLSDTVTELEQRGLDLARAQAEAEEQNVLLRDLGAALKDDVQGGVVELEVSDLGPIVRLSAARTFTRANTLRDAGKRALVDLARVVIASSGRRLELRWEGAARNDAERKARLEQIALALVSGGLDRKTIQIVPEAAPAPARANAPRVAISVHRAAR
jgi:hypothetical protein